MLPTPSTSHVPYARVYEPAEDSFLLLDTLSSAAERAFLSSRFPAAGAGTATGTAAVTLLELGTGSGVVLGFLTAHARAVFGRRDVVALGVDVNGFACRATGETVRRAVADNDGGDGSGEAGAGAGEKGDGNGNGSAPPGHGYFLAAVQGDLAAAVRPHAVDVLVFNPPYVPTEEVPAPVVETETAGENTTTTTTTTFEEDARLLALSYAGGRDGMEVTERVIQALPEVLSARGCAYLLLCAQNKPEEVKARIRALGGGGGRAWRAETVGTSGKQAGWEKLQIVRIWRDLDE